MYDDMMTHKHIQQIVSEESDDDNFFLFWINIADFSASYMRVQLQAGLLILKTGVSYTQVRLIHEYIC